MTNEQKMATCMIYSSYYDMDVMFVPTDNLTIQNHPANYDHLAVGMCGPDYECDNCKCYGFPCTNCNMYVYDGQMSESSIDEFRIVFNDTEPETPWGVNKQHKQQKHKLFPRNNLPEEFYNQFYEQSLKSYDDTIKGKSWADIDEDV